MAALIPRLIGRKTNDSSDGSSRELTYLVQCNALTDTTDTAKAAVLALPVTMLQIGGANGGPTSDATYTYKLTDPSTSPVTVLIAETEISTNTFGWWARTIGPVDVATFGHAFTDGTNWIVTWCNERSQKEPCPLT